MEISNHSFLFSNLGLSHLKFKEKLCNHQAANKEHFPLPISLSTIQPLLNNLYDLDE
jgi:hypothetical protein